MNNVEGFIKLNKGIEDFLFNKLVSVSLDTKLNFIKALLGAESDKIAAKLADFNGTFKGIQGIELNKSDVIEQINLTPDQINKLGSKGKIKYSYARVISGFLNSGLISADDLSKFDAINQYDDILRQYDADGAGKYKVSKPGTTPVALEEVLEAKPGIIADIESAILETLGHVEQLNQENTSFVGNPTITVSTRMSGLMKERLSDVDNAKVQDLLAQIKDGNIAKMDEANEILKSAKLKVKQYGGEVKVTTLESFLVISGPSGVGKGTIQEHFIDQMGITKWLINNTRNDRPGEGFGSTYHFIRSPKEADILAQDMKIPSEANVDSFISDLLSKYQLTEQQTKVLTSEITTAINKDNIDGIKESEIKAARAEEFNTMDDGRFVAKAVVNGLDFQGVGSGFVQRLLDGESVFLECDHQLASQIKNHPDLQDIDMNFLFVMPPSGVELASRLAGRGTENLDKVISRLSAAQDGMEGSLGVANIYEANNDAAKTAGTLVDNLGISSKKAITLETTQADVNANPSAYDGRLTTAHFINELKTKATGARDIVQIENNKVSEKEAVAELKSWLLDNFVLNDVDVKDVTADEFIANAREKFAYLAKTPKTDGNLLIMNGTFAPITFGHIGMAIQSLNQSITVEDGKAVSVMVQGGDTPHKPYALAEKHRAASAEAGTVGNDFLKSSRIRGLMRQAFNEAGFKALPAAYSDMAAFMFISAQNPKYNIIWASGADKVNGYYNEKHLIKDVLADVMGVKQFFYAERDDEVVEVFNQDRPADDWLHELNDKGSFVLLGTPTVPVSSTIVRNKLMSNDVINDLVPDATIDYIGRNDLKPAFQLSIVEKKITKGFKAAGVNAGKTIETFKAALPNVEDQAKAAELTKLIDQMEALYKEAKAKGLL